ncbi:MAG: hypothetical protein A3C53_07345 [Omnitrophica WOR_2 bacterium RIFCSPHIGHO2_02_FULL_68_15]|nr:MAG: hypothetical protein A3C53_07345 [Omnitrophica WOR_2 bacterium RIFCSPHIGHO2_02_FULL_68_15]
MGDLMEGGLTPEEKLLKIIELPNVPVRPRRAPPGAVTSTLARFALANLKSFKFDKQLLKQLDLRLANRLLLAVCVVLTVLGVSAFMIESRALDKRFEAILKTLDQADADQANPVEAAFTMDSLTAAMGARNVFTLTPSSSGTSGGATAKLGPTSTNVKLVGIIWSDHPQAMLEDTQEQKTYLLGPGEQIGDVTIKKILQDKVILGNHEREWELR